MTAERGRMRAATPADLNKLNRGTAGEALGIEFVSATPDELVARMPVDARTRQPLGLLHGGASVLLAETLGSVAANLAVDSSRFACVGLEINASHLSSARDGWVVGVARPLRVGRAAHVWEIRIEDETTKRLVCVSRLTVAVIPAVQPNT